jgi:hypothetical protein
MRLSRTSIQKAVAGVAVGSGLMVSGAASAGLVYDLRFADGDHTKVATAGGSYTLELWARVSGTNATSTDETLTYSYINIVSTQASGGAIASGGLSNGTLVAPFQGGGSRAGGPTEMSSTPDGVVDWGSSSTGAANTNYMFARTSTVGGELGGGTLGQAVGNSWEFKLATFTVNATTLGPGGTTAFNMVKPAATAFTGVSYAGATIDGSAFNVTNTNQQGAYAGSTGVLFLVPEPGSLGLLGAAAIGLIGRRRRQS